MYLTSPSFKIVWNLLIVTFPAWIFIFSIYRCSDSIFVWRFVNLHPNWLILIQKWEIVLFTVCQTSVKEERSKEVCRELGHLSGNAASPWQISSVCKVLPSLIYFMTFPFHTKVGQLIPGILPFHWSFTVREMCDDKNVGNAVCTMCILCGLHLCAQAESLLPLPLVLV